MPASPVTSTSWARPDDAERHAADSRASSAARPTNGDVPSALRRPTAAVCGGAVPVGRRRRETDTGHAFRARARSPAHAPASRHTRDRCAPRGPGLLTPGRAVSPACAAPCAGSCVPVPRPTPATAGTPDAAAAAAHLGAAVGRRAATPPGRNPAAEAAARRAGGPWSRAAARAAPEGSGPPFKSARSRRLSLPPPPIRPGDGGHLIDEIVGAVAHRAAVMIHAADW